MGDLADGRSGWGKRTSGLLNLAVYLPFYSFTAELIHFALQHQNSTAKT